MALIRSTERTEITEDTVVSNVMSKTDVKSTYRSPVEVNPPVETALRELKIVCVISVDNL